MFKNSFKCPENISTKYIHSHNCPALSINDIDICESDDVLFSRFIRTVPASTQIYSLCVSHFRVSAQCLTQTIK